jgi:hypothetical protein
VIEFLDESLYWENLKDKKKVKAAQDEQYAWFITRGVELCNDDGLCKYYMYMCQKILNADLQLFVYLFSYYTKFMQIT